MTNFFKFVKDNIVMIILSALLIMAIRNAVVSTYARDHIEDLEKYEKVQDRELEAKFKLLELRIKNLEKK
jgi:uncharacterized membrane protein